MFITKNIDQIVKSDISRNFALKKIMTEYEGIIAGGAAHAILRGYTISKHIQKNTTADIDVYFKDKNMYSSAVSFFLSKRSDSLTVEKSITGLCYNIYNLNTGLKIQLVGCVFGKPEDVVRSFDFENLEVYCDFKEDQYNLHYTKKASTSKDLLCIRHSRSPFLMHRIHKYINYRGYSGVTEDSKKHVTDWIIKASSGYYYENTDGCPTIYVNLLNNSQIKSMLENNELFSESDLACMIGKIKEDILIQNDYICSRGYARSTFIKDSEKDLVIEEIRRRATNECK